ncbi:hypothetical protein JS530_05630 [Bifidobacterium sp. LC6]|uniref:Uncharacterized protein n=1 Tax=Bifidobacterium colobi TaxID=2809026 RepID=A0ABS5UVC5_9BIFI|nr:hypothetical protein [Bifidobacterium colobi]MBT1174985.1 hypothetical protein [Bifidobacterium colobi]
MSTFNTPPEPNPINGFVGNPVTPFSYGECPCHQAVERSRNLINAQQAATSAVCERMSVASAKAKGIVWTGNAAILFRARLDQIMQAAHTLAQECESTHRLAWG